MGDTMYSTAEAEKFLGYASGSLKKMCARGHIKSTKNERGHYRIAEKDLIAYKSNKDQKVKSRQKPVVGEVAPDRWLVVGYDGPWMENIHMFFTTPEYPDLSNITNPHVVGAKAGLFGDDMTAWLFAVKHNLLFVVPINDMPTL